MPNENEPPEPELDEGELEQLNIKAKKIFQGANLIFEGHGDNLILHPDAMGIVPPWAKQKIHFNYADLLKPIPEYQEFTMKAKQSTSDKPKSKHSKKEAKERESDPKTRVSYAGSTWSDSTEAQWKRFDDFWVHESEEPFFHREYKQCDITKKWFHRHSMGITRSKGKIGEMWIGLVDSKPPEGYEKCPLNGYFWPSEEMMDSPDKDDELGRISISGMESHFIRDDYSKTLFYGTNKTRIFGMDGVKYVGPATIKSGVFLMCPSCDRYWPKAQVCHRKQLGEVHKYDIYCPTCFEKLIAENIILPHNHQGYPKAIYPIHKVRRLDHERRKIVWQHEEDQPRWKRLMGVELELEVHNALKDNARIKMALALLDHLGRDFILIKHDGSIAGTGGNAGEDRGGQYGFEVVSAPAHLDYHRAKWGTIEETPGFKTLRSWDTKYCGFHVHVSREALSNLQIGRILAFVNHPANADFIKKIAGRGPQKYAVINPKRLTDCLIEEAKSDGTRRVAVNLTNPNTIEFRMFRGTVRGVHIIRNLEFCDALCDYCLPASRSLKEMFDWRLFVEFTVNNKRHEKEHSVDTWPILSGWLRQSGMAPERKLQEGVKPKSFIEPGEVAEPALVIKSKFDPRLKKILKEPKLEPAHLEADEGDE